MLFVNFGRLFTFMYHFHSSIMKKSQTIVNGPDHFEHSFVGKSANLEMNSNTFWPSKNS